MRFYLFLFLFAFKLAVAQDGKGPEPAADYKGPCIVTFPKIKLQSNNADVAERFLKEYINNLKQADVGLRLAYVKESPGGFHYTYYQTYKGVEVYQSDIKVNTDRQNIVRSVLDNSFNTQGWNINVAGAQAQNVIALDASGKALLAERDIVNHFERITGEGRLIYQRDTRSYFAAPDSLVTGKIFNPDPLTTVGQLYTPGSYYDAGDTNTLWLNSQLQTVNFRVDFNGTTFKLENSYIKIADADSPKVAPVVTAVPDFSFTRSQTAFEDVNAFYHLNTYRDYAHSLGYNLADAFVVVDPHAWGVTGSYSDQSSFSPGGGGDPELLYGMGGVDDAEDADVIIHEYGHFLSYNAAPGTNVGNQRNSLDEGFGDYLAASYSAALSGFNKSWVFNWDGPPWSSNNNGGRTVASSKMYTTNLSGGIYSNAPIWSTALMNINGEIGRTKTDKLIFETHYSYASNIKMEDAARLYLEADTVLYSGQHYCPIYKHFFAQGLLPFVANPCGVSSVTSVDDNPFVFVPMGRGFRVVNTKVEDLQVRVYNISGALVSSAESNDALIDYSNTALPTGVYLVILYNGFATHTYKWCKTN